MQQGEWPVSHCASILASVLVQAFLQASCTSTLQCVLLQSRASSGQQLIDRAVHAPLAVTTCAVIPAAAAVPVAENKLQEPMLTGKLMLAWRCCLVAPRSAPAAGAWPSTVQLQVCAHHCEEGFA
jgi:hypothetical protein